MNYEVARLTDKPWCMVQACCYTANSCAQHRARGIEYIPFETWKDAEEVRMDEEAVKKPVEMRYAIHKFMDANDCNCYAAPCGDICSTRRMNEKQVTMRRVDPNCKQLFVASGKVVAGLGYGSANCSGGVFFEVADVHDFFQKRMNIGNHVPLICGDFKKQIIELGRELGLEILEA